MTKRSSRPAVLHLRKLKGESGINLPSLSKARLKELIEQAIVDAYGEEEQVGGFFTMIEEHFIGNVPNLGGFRQGTNFTQVQQDIKVFRTLGIALQFSKMIDHFGKRQHPSTPRANYPIRRVDFVRHRHARLSRKSIL